jgi:hypothetical protein
MNSIRAKQQMEILDVWKNINAQVTARTGKQIAVFPDTIAPKTQRDVGAEVNVDKVVEQLNKTIDQKLGALEYLIQNVEKSYTAKDTSYDKATQESETTGDVVPLWNSIVRSYQQPSLSRDSQNAIHVKVQELTPNLNAITYGLMSAIDELFSLIDQAGEGASDYDGGRILNLLRSYSVYKYIAKSVDTTTFQVLTVPMLETEFKNAFEDLTQDRVQLLKAYAPSATDILRSTVRNIPDFPVNDFADRVKSLEEELGFNLPADVIARMRRLNKPDQLVALAEVKNSVAPRLREERQGFDARERQIINQSQRLQDEIYQKLSDTRAVQQEIRIVQLQIEELESGEAEVNVEDQSIPVPQIPNAPERPDYFSFDSLDDYQRATDQYLAEVEVYEQAIEAVRQTEAYNDFVPELMRAESETKRQQMILSRQEEVDRLRAIAERLREELTRKRDEGNAFSRRYGIMRVVGQAPSSSGKITRERARAERNVAEAVKAILGAKIRPTKTDQRREEREEAERRLVQQEDDDFGGEFEESDVEVGQGRNLETRGMAGMRRNFGVKSSPTRKNDTYDFDDRRNESYYVKPVK